MKKKRFILTVVLALMAGSIAIYSAYANSSKAEAMSDVLLANLEALTTDEEKYKKFAERCAKTWEDGPFWDLYGKRYFVQYKIVECYGTGVVDCEPDASSQVVYN